MMTAVILAGGRGERLKPLTNRTPKPMVDINGKPFLWYQLKLLKKYKIYEILLCIGYLCEKIIDYFGNGKSLNLNIRYCIEKDFLGTGGALKKAKPYLPEEFILLYGDSYLPINYPELIQEWYKYRDRALGLITCYDNKCKIDVNNIYLDTCGIIHSYSKNNPHPKANCIDAGVSIFKKKIVDFIPLGKNVSLEEDIFPKLIKRKLLRGNPISQRYYDIGTPERLKEFTLFCQRKKY